MTTELRPEVIVDMDNAIAEVKRILNKMNDHEREYMMSNSAQYRQLIETVRRFYAGKAML